MLNDTANNAHNLALKDEILLEIEKPVRYIGHEVNSVIKGPGCRWISGSGWPSRTFTK